MLLASLALALIAFLCFIAYVGTAQTVWLVALFLAAGVGLVLFLWDWKNKNSS